jgi:hypothetical protein
VSEPESPTPPRRRFEPLRMGGALRSSALMVYGLLAGGMAGAALYMVFIERRELISPYVAGPAIGALWFGLRLFMMFSSRK